MLIYIFYLYYLPEFQTHAHWVVMPSNYLILCHSLLLSTSIFPYIRVFTNELALRIRWPKFWNFSFSPFIEHSVLISLRIDWFNPLAIPWTLILWHYNSKSSVLWHSAFFMVQLLHLYMTSGKSVVLTMQTFVRQEAVCSLRHCLGLSYFFLPRSTYLLISWL